MAKHERPQLLRIIGQGGMGQVWRARYAGRDVAVKVMRGARPRTELRDEARAVAALTHPNIIRVLDYGELTEADVSAPDQGSRTEATVTGPYLVMELCERGSCASLSGTLDWRSTKELVRSVLAALGHAHARGVIHLDLKPENLLLDDDGTVKLTDFGIAAALERDVTAVTVAGTPTVMAPEQQSGAIRDYGPWTDLFALGRCVLRLLSSDGGRARVPSGFSAWLSGLLEVRPEDRYQSAADAAHALNRLDDAAGDASAILDDVRGATTQTPTRTQTQETHPASAQSTALLIPKSRTTAPIPDAWPREALTDGSRAIGLGLYGLRSVPFFGRARERDALWSALREVARTGQPRLAVVAGESGVGKSRLCAWLSETASEVSGVAALRAVHSPAGAFVDGLAGMVRRHVRAQALSGVPLRDHLERKLRRSGVTSEYEWQALAEIVAPDSERGAIRFQSPTERYVLILRLCARLATDRPVVVFLDDVQWGADALAFTKELLAAEHPILVVATVRDDALAERPVERQLVAELSSHPRATRLSLEPLDGSTHRALCADLLGLDDELVARVAERTSGSPLFAVQLVGDWVTREILEPGPRGLRVTTGARVDLPRDIHEVWRARVARLLEGQPEHVGHALERTAVLGQRVERAEWRELLIHMDASNEEMGALVEQMLDERLARRAPGEEDAGWSFAHAMLRESLEQRAREGGRFEGHHRACARVLAPRGPRARERMARHLLAAGEVAEALGPLLDAACGRLLEGAVSIATELLAEHEAGLRVLGVAPSDPRWARGWVEQARAARFRHEMDLSAELGEKAAATSDPEVRILALFSLSDTLRDKGQHARAAAVLEQVRPLVRDDDRWTLGELLRREGHLRKARGDLAAALADAEQAIVESNAAGDHHAAATAALLCGTILWRLNHLAEGKEATEQARRAYIASGSHWGIASCENTLGEIARLSGAFDDAVAHYERSLAEYQAIGSKYAVLAEVNVAFVYVEQARYDEARPILERGLPRLTQQAHMAAWLHAALLPCLAGQTDWEAWDRHFEAVEQSARTFVDADLARMVELGADVADAADGRRAALAYALAADQWSRMSDTGKLTALESKLARRTA